MTYSDRITVDFSLARAVDAVQAHEHAQALRILDTPQALPVLAQLDRRTPDWFVIAARAVIGFALSLVALGLLQAVASVFSTTALTAALWVTRSIDAPLHIVLILVCLAWACLLVYVDKSFLELMRYKDSWAPDRALKSASKTLLWLPRIVAWALVVAFQVCGITVTVSVAGFGLVGGFDILAREWLRTGVSADWCYLIAVVVIILVTVLIYKGYGFVPLAILWGIGVMTLLQIGDREPITFAWIQSVVIGFIHAVNDGINEFNTFVLEMQLTRGMLLYIIRIDPAWSLTLPAVPVVIGLSAFYPLFFARVLMLLAQRWYVGQRNLHVDFLDRIRARLSVYKAYRTLIKRNRRKVGGDGSHTICKRDLVYFRRSSAGLVPFWWCPACHDDDNAWVGVHWIRGVMDTAMIEQYNQVGSILQVNLRNWIVKDHTPARALLPRDVYIIKVADTHEPEVLIVHYNNILQRMMKWPRLAQLNCVVAADSQVEELTLRQISHAFLSVTTMKQAVIKTAPVLEKA